MEFRQWKKLSGSFSARARLLLFVAAVSSCHKTKAGKENNQNVNKKSRNDCVISSESSHETEVHELEEALGKAEDNRNQRTECRENINPVEFEYCVFVYAEMPCGNCGNNKQNKYEERIEQPVYKGLSVGFSRKTVGVGSRIETHQGRQRHYPWSL